jgi:hypothetical protein
MNIVLDDDERRGVNAPISWLYFTRLDNCNRGDQRGLMKGHGASLHAGQYAMIHKTRTDLAVDHCLTWSWWLPPHRSAPRTAPSPHLPLPHQMGAQRSYT